MNSHTTPAAVPHGWYELSAQADTDETHVADPVDHDDWLRRRLARADRLEEIVNVRWSWRAQTEPPDFPFTADTVRLVSARARAILEARLGAADDIQWIPAALESERAGRLEYWIAHFPTHFELLDPVATSRGSNGVPIHHVFSAERLDGHAIAAYSLPARQHRRRDRVITLPSMTAALTWIVSREVAEALVASGVTGARLSPAAVAGG
jgi:hypothetical protein